MTTLESLAFTVAGGSAVFVLSLSVFGCAVKRQSKLIAPRAAARPPTVIYNPEAANVRGGPPRKLQRRGGKQKRRGGIAAASAPSAADASSSSLWSSQARGNPWTGWIPWTLQFSYHDMLRGIPGTGTRRGGLSGSMLKVSLDQVVLLRFHAMCLRVVGLLAVLYVCIVMPLNLSARCFDINDESEDCHNTTLYNLTNYERSTITNIPPLSSGRGNSPIRAVSAGMPAEIAAKSLNPAGGFDGHLARLYVTVFMFWIGTVYLVAQLLSEWIQILAMRRVYYLEQDIWGERREEHKQTLLYQEQEARNHHHHSNRSKSNTSSSRRHQRQRQQPPKAPGNTSRSNNGKPRQQQHQHFTFDEEADKQQSSSHNANKNNSFEDDEEEESHLIHRDPWIPHPEQRDTVPNIALYSVLVGCLPSLPEHAGHGLDAEVAISFSKRDNIDWQLQLTSIFFDHCVPNQPGFSSSVAAVTIIPAAKDLSAAWRKWYAAASKLRRLRYIRELIAQKRYYQIEDHHDEHEDDDDDDENDENDEERQQQQQQQQQQKNGTHDAGNNTILGAQDQNGSNGDSDEDNDGSSVWDLEQVPTNRTSSTAEASALGISPRPIYGRTVTRNRTYYREVLGQQQEYDYEVSDAKIYEALRFGPEQTAVYSREFAQAAAPCCPRGCHEHRLRLAGIDELIELERETLYDVHEANLELRKARYRAARMDEDGNKKKKDKDKKPSQHPKEQQQSARQQPTQQQGSITALDTTATAATAATRATSIAMDVVAAPSTSERKTHKKKPSVEDCTFPKDLALESKLYMQAQQQIESGSNHGNNNHNSSSNHGINGSSNHGHHGHHGHGQQQRQQHPLLQNTNATKKPEGGGLPPPMKGGKPPTGHRKRKSSPTDVPLPEDFEVLVDLEAAANNVVHHHPLDGDEKKSMDTISLGRGGFSRSASSSGSNSSSLANNNNNTNSSVGHPLRARFVESERSSMAAGAPSSHLLQEDQDMITPKLPKPKSKDDSKDDGDGGNNPVNTTVNGAAASSQESSAAGQQQQQPATGQLLPTHFEPEDYYYSTTHRLGSEWAMVECIVDEAHKQDNVSDRSSSLYANSLRSGRWGHGPTFRQCLSECWHSFRRWAKKRSKQAVAGVARDSTYAIVTFTSRQAAVAARAALADGRGAERWIAMPELPIPPMADAAAFDLMACRNCCRPVTLSINERQKFVRKVLAIALLATIYVFYTVPLTAASNLVKPERLDEVCPICATWSQTTGIRFTNIASGFFSAMIWTLFFSICPFMFKAIANFGSAATSVAHAEFRAMQYYWWFMVLTAFSGTLIANMVLNVINDLMKFGYQARELLQTVAASIPGTMSASWLNWIIFRVLVTLPLSYLLQINVFLFEGLGLKCCARMSIGGGPGGPIPYRIYIDSGVVMMCAIALAPQSPLVAPAAFVYFLVTQPLLRRNVIFMYRPKYDGGGLRWPFIFDMCISGLVVGQVLLTMQMILKNAFGPSVAAFLPMIPTFLFQRGMKKRFLRAYEDAALLQTSLLDGWDTTEPTSDKQREEFRQFLVDAHKAAYIPICIAGTDTDDFLTAEPAVVVPYDADIGGGGSRGFDGSNDWDTASSPHLLSSSHEGVLPSFTPRKTQHGATLRRTMGRHNLLTPINENNNNNANGDNESSSASVIPLSPFDRSWLTSSIEKRNREKTA